MHINDVFVLRSVLRNVAAGKAVDRKTLNALIEAADQEVAEFEAHIEEMALREEAMQQ